MKDSFIKRKLVLAYECIYSGISFLNRQLFYRLRIMNSDRTINYIIRHKCSVSRYGEGEFNIMFWTSKITFQQQDEALAKSMRETLKSKNPNLLLCVPKTINTRNGLNNKAKQWWDNWCKNKQKDVVSNIRNFSGKCYVFGDALITRPYMDYKSPRKAQRTFKKLKMLWNNRDILIVEGEKTRLGVGNDLFDNAKSIKRILCPATNAFSCYEDIKSNILKHHNHELILIALGPTATVLAADLAAPHRQAIDIGHIDIEYEWFLSGAKEKTAVKGKYTNEVIDGRQVSECNDERYINQIISTITYN